MERQRRVKAKALGAFAAVFAISTLLPAAASAQGKNLVDELLGGVLGGGGAGGPAPAAGTPPNYQPPLHGANPHGQGTVGVVDLAPSPGAPLSGDPSTGDEELVIGDSQGSQDGSGNYHGRVTLLHANLLGIVNTPVIENKTNEGETKVGPLDPLQQGVLNNACTQLGQGAGCVTVLQMDSTSNNTGSTNDFRVAGINITGVLNLGAAGSHGDISESGGCQTANGNSDVANANVLNGLVTAGVLNSSSSSQACNTGSQSQTNDSDVLTVQDVALTDILQPGCGASGNPGTPATPDTQLVNLLPITGIVCAADDSNGNGEPGDQTSDPYGVREALTVFALNVPLFGVTPIKIAVSGPESHAVAPAATTPAAPGGGNPAGEQGGPGGDNDDGPGGPGGPAATTAQAGGDELPFTGANLVLLGLIGGALTLGGWMLARSARRNRRATA